MRFLIAHNFSTEEPVTQETIQIAIGATYGFLLGGVAGGLGYWWAIRLTPIHPPSPILNYKNRTALLSGLTGLLLAGFVVAMLEGDCQATAMVRPNPFWQVGRLFYHGILLWLLVVATITDLRDYLIPDEITLTGILIGVAGATVSGDLQMMHLWIDWNQEIPGVQGAYIPEWIKNHHHWHGLAWSVAGMATGAGLTWIVRVTSALILGRQALGFGDVTLMAMIGSFLGWQPTVCVFVLAPLCGIVLALATWVFTGRSFVPYGPYLAAAAVLVMFTWRWIWPPLKWTFGDWQSLALLAGISLTALLILLGVLRFYWSIPVKSTRQRDESSQ